MQCQAPPKLSNFHKAYAPLYYAEMNKRGSTGCAAETGKSDQSTKMTILRQSGVYVQSHYTELTVGDDSDLQFLCHELKIQSESDI